MSERLTPEQRFWSKVDRTDECWFWRGTQRGNGYGCISIKHKLVPVHRYAYELLKGSIPNGLQLDHLCRTPLCVNPAHLEIVTLKTNVLRGQGLTAQNARATHCVYGHPFNETNTRRQGNRRYCKLCGRRRTALYEARLR